MSNFTRQRTPDRGQRHRKMSDVQAFWSSCEECVEFWRQKRNGAVLMESKHEEGQTGAVSEKKE